MFLPRSLRSLRTLRTIRTLPLTLSVARPSTVTIRPLSSSSGTDVWDWVPPAHSEKAAPKDDKYVLPIVEGELFTAEEVREYLTSQGAENAIVLTINGDLDQFKKFVIATGRSTRHIRKMSQSVVTALKDRKLFRVLGSKGVEGGRDDDWQLVNCQSFLVHVMLPDTRRHVDLESHWTMKERPCVPYSKSEAEYEENFSRLLDQYPCPDDYIKTHDIIGDIPVVKEL